MRAILRIAAAAAFTGIGLALLADLSLTGFVYLAAAALLVPRHT